MNEFYIQRHFKLWEDNNKLLNRIVFLTVVISLSLVIKVLDPFVDLSEEKNPIFEAVASLNQEKEIVNQKLLLIEQTAKVLEGVNAYISNKPWQKEKQDLIKRYQTMREGYTREQYQQTADNTINTITEGLHDNVLSPLQQSVESLADESARPQQLIQEINSLNQFIDDWKKNYTGKNWYRTIGRKDETMYRLTEDINQRLRQFSRVIKNELNVIEQKKTVVDKELGKLNAKIDAESDKLKELDKQLQKILPEWLRGFIKIEQVIQLLPAALLFAVTFVIFLGLSLTRHYRIYIDNQKIGSEITRDPGMSSVWTLIFRGFTGTLLTVAAYSLFIVFNWLIFERTMALFLDWLIIDPSHAWLSSLAFWEAFVWIGRAGFALLLVFFITRTKSILHTDKSR